jgi:hypothetical protein
MTRRTALLRSSAAAVVSRVIEFHIKAFDKTGWKRFHCRRRLFQIVVTQHANTRFGICKFGQMTSDTRIVSGIFQLYKILIAFMTRIALLFMFGNTVRKFAVILVGSFDNFRFSRLCSGDGDIRFLLLFQTTRRKNRQRRENEQCFN